MGVLLYAHSGKIDSEALLLALADDLINPGPGPNPLKPAILLNALHMEYEVKAIPFGEEGVKSESFMKLNPNGRVPAIVDRGNNDFVVWESGAIMHYLCNMYDLNGKLGGRTVEEKAIIDQWLCLQLSGLGPVQGNVNWFKHYHEKTHGEAAGESVIKRFRDETERLYDVLEKQLAAQEKKGSQYIALDRLTIADISFHVWLRMERLNDFGSLQEMLGKFPKLSAYADRIEALDCVKSANKKLEESYK